MRYSKFVTVGISLIFAAFLSSCTRDSPDMVSVDDMLSAEEIRAAIVGNTMTGYSTRHGVHWTEYYLQDGTLRGIYDEGQYTANWYLSGSELCWDYQGTEYDGCGTMSLSGEEVVFYESGKIAGRARLLKGNPEGL